MTQQSATRLEIPPPAPDTFPRVANIYDEAIKQNSALAPIFPFTHPGSMYSGTANLRGDMRPGGRFEHNNEVDEILLCLGSSIGQLRSGQMFVQKGSHDVSGIDSGSPDDFLVFYYIQRQRLEGTQKETVGFHCEQCNKIVFEHGVDWLAQDFSNAAGRPLAPTIIATEQAGAQLNDDPALRTCSDCGHENAPFAKELWATRYSINGDLVGQAEVAMRALAD